MIREKRLALVEFTYRWAFRRKRPRGYVGHYLVMDEIARWGA